MPDSGAFGLDNTDGQVCAVQPEDAHGGCDISFYRNP